MKLNENIVVSTTDSGQTPLHLAASEGHLECARILVKAGADVLVKDNMGFTPLDLARIWCHREVARYRAKGTANTTIKALLLSFSSYSSFIFNQVFCLSAGF